MNGHTCVTLLQFWLRAERALEVLRFIPLPLSGWPYRELPRPLCLSMFIYLLSRVSLLLPRLECNGRNFGSPQPLPVGFKRYSCLSFLGSWDYRHVPHAWLSFVFLVETRFLPIGQAGLELSTSGDLPASASQSAGITGVSHHARPIELL